MNILWKKVQAAFGCAKKQKPCTWLNRVQAALRLLKQINLHGKQKVQAAFALFLLLPIMVQAASRVVTSDWSTAETLAAMGYPPVSMGDKRAYNAWVNSPPMPSQTTDAGLRFQPNREYLHSIKPDFFIQSPWFAFLRPQFEAIAPVYEVAFATKQGMDYANTVAATRQVGKLIGQSAAAEKLIAQTEQQFVQAALALQAYRNRPLAVVQFVNARHLRIYGKTSLFQIVLNKLSLQNAWSGASNEWGFANITLAELSQLPTQTLLIIVQPHPRNVRGDLAKSALWQRLPFSLPENRRVLPPSWSYGALPSMQRFATLLATKLPTQKEMAW